MRVAGISQPRGRGMQKAMIEKSGGKGPAEYGIDWDARDQDLDLENRLMETGYTPEDGEVENPLRPRTFSEYVGQDKVKENLKIFFRPFRARKRNTIHKTADFPETYPQIAVC